MNTAEELTSNNNASKPCNDVGGVIKPIHTNINEEISRVMAQATESFEKNGYVIYNGPTRDYVLRKVPGSKETNIEDRIHFLIRVKDTTNAEGEAYAPVTSLHEMVECLAIYILRDFDASVLAYLSSPQLNNKTYRCIENSAAYIIR